MLQKNVAYERLICVITSLLCKLAFDEKVCEKWLTFIDFTDNRDSLRNEISAIFDNFELLLKVEMMFKIMSEH